MPTTERITETVAAIQARIDEAIRARGNYPESLDNQLYAVQCAAHFEDAGALARIRQQLGFAD